MSLCEKSLDALQSEEETAPSDVVTPLDVMAVADFLGLRVGDAPLFELYWIAKQAAEAALPDGWELIHEGGVPKYFNRRNQSVNDRHPLEDYFVKLVSSVPFVCSLRRQKSKRAYICQSALQLNSSVVVYLVRLTHQSRG